MAEQLFAIVFKGQLRAGADGGQVRANFAKLFNIDAARVEQMFSGQAVIIKKGLDLLAADKYKAALAKAGAEVEVIDMPVAAAPAAAPPPVAAVAVPQPAAPSVASAAPVRAATATPVAPAITPANDRRSRAMRRRPPCVARRPRSTPPWPSPVWCWWKRCTSPRQALPPSICRWPRRG